MTLAHGAMRDQCDDVLADLLRARVDVDGAVAPEHLATPNRF
jgi:hypothetical protein